MIYIGYLWKVEYFGGLQMDKRNNLKIGLIIMVFLFAVGSSAFAERIIYVDDDANGLNDGSSWQNAYNFLQDALADAQSSAKPVEIRVAQGTYRPDEDTVHPDGTGDREAAFQLINGVTLKGGYAGAGFPDPNERNIEQYETILSGDLDGNDVDINDPYELLIEPTRAENSYHIFYHPEDLNLDDTAILDGFTITGGNACSMDANHDRGGGVYNEFGNPTLRKCVFRGNSAISAGGGMLNEFGSPRLVDCRFIGNSTGKREPWEGFGGAMYNRSSNAFIANCIFSNNGAVFGGGMYNDANSNPKLISCSFLGNTAVSGGGMENHRSCPELTKCTFSGNLCSVGGGGMENHRSCPELTKCTFSGNLCSVGSGGGLLNDDDSSPVLTKCIFNHNSAGWTAGGIYNGNSNLTLTNCIFTGNIVTFFGVPPWLPFDGLGGGAILNSNSNLTMANCTFIGNSAHRPYVASGSGGAICNYSNNYVIGTNSLFVKNSADNGNALSCDSSVQIEPSYVQLTSCILWDYGNEIWNNDNSTVTIRYSDIQGGWPGEGNINADPCFVNPDANDYHLLPGSPCIDMGAAGNYEGQVDMDEQARVMGPRVDMGADEVCDGCLTCKGDLDRNGFIMQSDLFEMISILGRTGPPYIIADCQRLWNPCADMDDNGFIMLGDLFALIAQLGQAGPPYIILCP